MPSTTSCILCRSCANYLGGAHQERRTRARLCAAGVERGPTFYTCESFVALLRGSRRARGVTESDVGKDPRG